MYGFTTKRASTESTAGWCVTERCAEISPGPGGGPEERPARGVTPLDRAGVPLRGGCLTVGVVIRIPSRVTGPGADTSRGHPISITRNGARRGYIRALRMRITVPLGRLRRFGGIA